MYLSPASALLTAATVTATAVCAVAIDAATPLPAAVACAATYLALAVAAAVSAVRIRPHRDQYDAYQDARDDLAALADAQWERGITVETDEYLRLNARVERLGAQLPVWLR